MGKDNFDIDFSEEELEELLENLPQILAELMSEAGYEERI